MLPKTKVYVKYNWKYIGYINFETNIEARE